MLKKDLIKKIDQLTLENLNLKQEIKDLKGARIISLITLLILVVVVSFNLIKL